MNKFYEGKKEDKYVPLDYDELLKELDIIKKLHPIKKNIKNDLIQKGELPEMISSLGLRYFSMLKLKYAINSGEIDRSHISSPMNTTINISCEHCGYIYDFVYFEGGNICKKCNRFSANLYKNSKFKDIINSIEIDKLIQSQKRKYKNKIKCENCGYIYDYILFEDDCICKKCNRFSANLYNFSKEVKYRLKSLKKLHRWNKGNRLDYLGIVFDSTFQVYPISERENQNTLDYISRRYFYENPDVYKKNKEDIYLENFVPNDLISYEKGETFSFDYNKLTFIFTGEFTSEIRKGLIENTTRFIEHLFSLDIIKYENLCSDIPCEAEVEKLASYIQILEHFFVIFIRVKSVEIDQVIDSFFQKID